MVTNHPLKKYRQTAAHYLRRARATRDPILRQALFAVASLSQEKASRRENTIAMYPPNHPLNSYHRRTWDYWRRALAAADPVLQGVLSALAGTYQELAARRENHLAREGAAAEPPGAARERRARAMLARAHTPSLRRRKKTGG